VRKIFSNSQGGNNAIFRRAWGAWNRMGDISPNGTKQVFTIAYASYNGLCENCIGVWHEDSTPIGERRGIFANDHFNGGTQDNCSNAKYIGSIGLMLSSWNGEFTGVMRSANDQDCMSYDNVVAYTEKSTIKTAQLNNCGSACNTNGVQGSTIRNTTEIGGATDSIGSEWTVVNRVNVATVGAAPNIWNGAGDQGARVCKRYVGGVLTSTPLFTSAGKWPMGARINAALTAAGRDPDDYFGAGNEISDLLEDIFGAIPAACKGGPG
jgi:hypothetical protein